MKISIISGSHRENAQSLKVARYMEKEIQERMGLKTYLLSLSNNPLPLWDESIWNKDPDWNERLAPIRKELESSDALIIIAPEWHGQVPAGLKNFFLIFGKQELGHKPALITAVSSVDGGAYPVAELRMSSYKNNRICYIPEQLIIRNVETVLNLDPENNNASADNYFRARIQWTLDVLQQYAEALSQVRASGVAFNKDFGNGM